ncbi:rod shape-determining protein MreD [Bacteroidetes/Chlorobi group bacterium MS-B_bin-24]|jgi:rod shape-determining protein MreD|nr:MAG: rod shape-determining protein MreD [Bacteroidetes/Chlorobi group bacterium MS-B_bin-24]
MVEQSLKIQNTYLKIIYYALATLLICVLQLSFSYLISIYGVTPDLLILLVIWVTLFEGKLYGLIFAFSVGILFDFLSMNVVGVNALTKTIVAYLAGFFYQEKEFWNIIRSNKFFLICFLATLLHNIVYYFIMVELTDSIFAIYFKFVIGSTIYTMLFTLLAFFFRIRKFW